MIRWEKRYEIGHPVIDLQHRVLVRTFNEFEEKLQGGQVGFSEMKELLLFLRHYASWHFGKEEDIATCYCCPVAEKNRNAHEGFIRRFEKRFQELKALEGNQDALLSLAREVHGELSRWLISHVLNVDQKIGKCIHEARKNEKEGSS